MSVENDVVMEWKRLADLDLKTARHLFEIYRPMPVEIICFHSQQAAEKILKCFLVFNEIEPPKTHDLQILMEMVLEIDGGFNDVYYEATSLTQYAVFSRYPSERELNESDAEIALKRAGKVMDYVSGLIL